MDLKKKLNQGLALGLTAVLLGGLAGCGTPAASSSEAVSEVASAPGIVQEQTDLNAQIKMVTDDSDDTTEPTTVPFPMDGEHVRLTAKAQAKMDNFDQTAGMYEVDGAIVLVTAKPASMGTEFGFNKVDTETGKLIHSATCFLPNAAEGGSRFLKNIRGDERYGSEGYDLLIATTAGSYLFDLDDLSKQPSINDLSKLDFAGELWLETSTGQLFTLTHDSRDIDVPSGKVAYSTNEGVFVANVDGSEVEKVADQPAVKNWLALYDDYDKPTTETQTVLLSKIRFIDDGQKIVASLMNYDTAYDELGFVVIDIAAKTVTEYPYFTAESAIKALPQWETLENGAFSGYYQVDEQTIAALVVGNDKTVPYSTARFDIYIDLATGQIARTGYSPTGITADYKTLAVNDDYRGASGKCTFFDMVKGDYLKGGVLVTTDASQRPMGVTQNYALFTISDNTVKEKPATALILAKITPGVYA